MMGLGLLLLSALPPGPAVELELGVQWHSEDLNVDGPGAGRFLPSYSAAAFPLRLLVRPLAGAEPSWLDGLFFEARWLRSLDQAVPMGPVVRHQTLRGRLGTRLGLSSYAGLSPFFWAAWSQTRFDDSSGLLAPRSFRWGGGACFEYGGRLRWAGAVALGYLAELEGLAEQSGEDGLAAEAEVELSARVGALRIGGRLGFETQRFGPGSSWDRLGGGVVLAWEVEALGRAPTITD
ncbi:MAG: hypothetical protein AAF851_14170 [Myxococcota bacterium]